MTEKKERAPRRIGLCALRGGRVFEWIASILFLGLGAFTLLYYISGPALGYLHSDCVDSLLWAQVSVESGELLSEDFVYAAILPFGSPIWMMPIIKLFGFTVRAQVLSMCVFALIFLLSALFFFRSLRWRYSASSAAVFCLVMILSGSVKIREIMWEHVIYYSLGILFLMLTLGLVFRLWDNVERFWGGTPREKSVAIIFALLLLLLSAGCATDGFQVVGLTVIPALGAIAAYTVFDKETRLDSPSAIRRYSICAVMAIGVILGALVLSVITKGGEISAGYGEAYSGWSDVGSWWENAEQFLPHYLTLAGVLPNLKGTLFSSDSVVVFIRLFGALAVLVSPFLLLFNYKEIEDKYSRLVAWAHLALTAVTLVGFVCGRLSNVNWRLTPFLGSSVIATIVYIKHLLGKGVVMRRVGVILAALLLCFSLVNAKEMLDMPYDLGREDPLQDVADTLEEKGYDYGYATFWNAGETWLRSDGEVKVINVVVDRDGVAPRRYQTMDYWFDDVEGQTDYFLLLEESEYYLLNNSKYWDKLTEERNIIDEFKCGDYYIIVFDGNLFVE
ncbi:MAG: hypothetical protein J6Q77_03595 [Clostridia bacterium]|nr:hypothetical protein [Clostridia bacterium]